MRKILKYILMISYYSILVFLLYDMVHCFYSPAHDVTLYVLFLFVMLVFLAVIPYGMHYDDLLRKTRWKGAELVIFSPSLGKKIYHESGVFYMEYNKKADSYELYYDRILYKMPIKTIGGYCIDHNSADGAARLIQLINIELNSKYEDLIRKKSEKRKQLEYANEKEKLLNNWDGHTSERNKRDILIDKII